MRISSSTEVSNTQAISTLFAFAQFLQPSLGIAYRLVRVIPVVGADGCTEIFRDVRPIFR